MRGTDRFYAGQLALVVGGSQGIGRALAEGLVRRSCHVVIAARQEPRLEACAAALGSVSSEARVQATAFDASDWSLTRAAIEDLVAREGVPDFVFNCAGLARPGWLDTLQMEAVEEMVRVNLMGTVHVCKAALPHFLARRRGHFVNVASLGGGIGLCGYTGYCASKFGVVGFSEALRRETRRSGVAVSIVCPPNTRTPGFERENREKPPEVRAQEERVRTLEAGHVAEAVLRALPGRPRLIFPTLDARLAWYLERWAPWLLDGVLERLRTSSG